MKKIVTLISLLLAGAMALHAQQTLYVIDNETVEDFDGSQLKGKIVKDYKITTKGSGKNAILVHAITTSPYAFSVSGMFQSLDSLKLPDFSKFRKFNADSLFMGHSIMISGSQDKKIVYLIDGEETELSSVSGSLSSPEIASIKVLTGKESEKLGYPEGTRVIEILTKGGKDSFVESIKSLPGVTVDPDGKITVNGEPIKRITLNGRSYKIDSK